MHKMTLQTVIVCILLLLATACGSGTAVFLETQPPTESVQVADARIAPTGTGGGSTATARAPQLTETVAATRLAPSEPTEQNTNDLLFS